MSKQKNFNFPTHGLDNLNTRSVVDSRITKCNIGTLHQTNAIILPYPPTPVPREPSTHPAIVDNVVYFGCRSDGIVIARPLDGSPGWTVVLTPTAGSRNDIQLTVTVGSKLVYLNMFGGDVFGLDRKTGATVTRGRVDNLGMSPNLPAVFSTPVLNEEHNILWVTTGITAANPNGSSKGSIQAFHADNLEAGPIWVYPTTGNIDPNAPNHGLSGVGLFEPVAHFKESGQLLIAAGTGQNYQTNPPSSLPSTPISDSLLLLDGLTGAYVRHVQFTKNDINDPLTIDTKNWDVTSIIIVERKSDCGGKFNAALVGTKEGMAYLVRISDCKILWPSVMSNPGPSGSAYNGVNTFGCIDKKRKHVFFSTIYSRNGLRSVNNVSLLPDPSTGLLTIASEVFCLKIKTGRVQWKTQFTYTGGSVGPLTYVNGMIIFCIFDGNLIADQGTSSAILRVLDAKNGDVLKEFKPEGALIPGTNSGASVYDNKIFWTYATPSNQAILVLEPN